MTYEERMKDFCLHCPQRCKEQACGYVMRNLERDCIYLQDVMTGWELGQQDTLEVKEIDIEDSVKETLAQKYIDYTFRRHNIDANSKEGQLIYYAYMHGMNQCLTQLKAQKGEEL